MSKIIYNTEYKDIGINILTYDSICILMYRKLNLQNELISNTFIVVLPYTVYYMKTDILRIKTRKKGVFSASIFSS